MLPAPHHSQEEAACSFTAHRSLQHKEGLPAGPPHRGRAGLLLGAPVPAPRCSGQARRVVLEQQQSRAGQDSHGAS